MGNIQQVMWILMIWPLQRLSLILLFVFTIFFSHSAYSQCPQISVNSTNIATDNKKGNITISTTADVNFLSVRVMLYNFDEAVYYYDSWNRENIPNHLKFNIGINSNSINIKDLPQGDYAIVIEQQGCKKQVLGLGYSGFPNSAIKIARQD